MNNTTLNKLVRQCLEMANGGSVPNDSQASYELVRQWVEEQRAILISQSISKGDDINDSWIQYINCVDLEQIDSSSCPCEVTSGCLVLKSKQRLPSTIDTWEDNNINSVVTPLGVVISKTNPVKSRYDKYNKYTGEKRAWFIKDDYLYILNEEMLESVSVSGVFEYPMDVARFTCNGQPCMTEDSPYPVSLNLMSNIIDIVVKTKIIPFMQSFASMTNDANGLNAKQLQQDKQTKP